MHPQFRTTRRDFESLATDEVSIPTVDAADRIQVDASWTPEDGALIHVGSHSPLDVAHAAQLAAHLSALVAAAISDLPNSGNTTI